MMTTVSPKQRLALVMKYKRMKDRDIASTLGLQRRESACRLRQRGRRAIARTLAACGNPMSVDEVIRQLADAATAPVNPLAMAS